MTEILINFGQLGVSKPDLVVREVEGYQGGALSDEFWHLGESIASEMQFHKRATERHATILRDYFQIVRFQREFRQGGRALK